MNSSILIRAVFPHQLACGRVCAHCALLQLPAGGNDLYVCTVLGSSLTPTRHCGYSKSLLAFLMRSKCFRCSLMPTLNDSQSRQRTYVKKPADDISGTDLFTKSDRPVGQFENVIYNMSMALVTRLSNKSLHIQPQTQSVVYTLAEREKNHSEILACTVISARQSQYASPFGLLLLTQQSATYLVSSA